MSAGGTPGRKRRTQRGVRWGLLVALGIALLSACGGSVPEHAASPVASEGGQLAPIPTATPRPPDPTPTRIPSPAAPARVRLPTPAARLDRLAIALEGAPSAGEAGIFVARERGYYREVGLDIYFHVVPGREAVLKALIDGRDDLALLGGPDLLRARSSGAPLLAVAALHSSDSASGYDLVLAASETTRTGRSEQLRAFLAATRRGYAEVGRQPSAAAETLARANPDADRAAIQRMLAALAPTWAGSAAFGVQSEEHWRRSHRSLAASGELASELDVRSAFTNELLPPPTLASAPTATAGAVTPGPTARPPAGRP